MNILGILLGILVSVNLIIQSISWYQFKNAGARFTAADGQELCLRIKRLEEVSYGVRDTNLHVLDCNYNKPTP